MSAFPNSGHSDQRNQGVLKGRFRPIADVAAMSFTIATLARLEGRTSEDLDAC